MAKKLTAVGISNLAPRQADKYGYEVGDVEPGLKVWVSPTGAKSFVVRYKTGGKGRKLTLGPVADYTLQQARDFARETMRRARQGEDPAREKRAKKIAGASAADAAAATSVDRILERYISAKLAEDADPKVRLKSGGEVERLLRREIIPFWAGRPMASITRDDVDERIAAIRDRAPVVANRTLANLRSACKWMVKNRIIPSNPCEGVDLEPDAEVRRERVLSEGEVSLLIRASRRLAKPWPALIRLMLLTGVRRGEAAGAHRGELHQFNGVQFWTVPAERTKNGRPLEIPLTDELQALFASLPEIGKHGLFFTTTGTTPVSGFSRMKRTLNLAMLDEAMKDAASRGLDPTDLKIRDWHLHDIRRTVATGMAGLGVAPHIVEAVLNHVSGARAGVAGTYNRAAYGSERAAALTQWADYLAKIGR